MTAEAEAIAAKQSKTDDSSPDTMSAVSSPSSNSQPCPEGL
jgi:hypothetical protein